MFGYVTSVVVQYFHRSLGVPAALAITGLLILGLAVVSARLMRATHPPKPSEPGREKRQRAWPGQAQRARREEPVHRDLPKAS